MTARNLGCGPKPSRAMDSAVTAASLARCSYSASSRIMVARSEASLIVAGRMLSIGANLIDINLKATDTSREDVVNQSAQGRKDSIGSRVYGRKNDDGCRSEGEDVAGRLVCSRQVHPREHNQLYKKGPDQPENKLVCHRGREPVKTMGALRESALRISPMR